MKIPKSNHQSALDNIQVVSIHGVPRSGTSWLGQIFNCHSKVAYRFQPLFSYRFKDRINLYSSREEVLEFLKDLLEVADDDFILYQMDFLPDRFSELPKSEQPSHLVMKMVRYHHLIEKFMGDIPDIKVIGIIRNPCAVINSWLQAPKEFKKEWDPLREWRYAPSKNVERIEEYYGFEKWKQVTSLFLDLETKHADKFRTVRYEELVDDPITVTKCLFDFVNLETDTRVLDFIDFSRSKHNEDPYSVFKDPKVKDRWRDELDPRIKKEIFNDLEGKDLEIFLI